jgi:hypothetical protein
LATLGKSGYFGQLLGKTIATVGKFGYFLTKMGKNGYFLAKMATSWQNAYLLLGKMATLG